MVLSLLLLSLSLVYATPVPFNLLKSIVAPIAVTSSFSSFGNLPSRSIALSQSQIHSQIQSIPYSVPQSSFGAVGSSRFGTESRSANTVKMIVGGTDVDTNQFPFYLFGYSGKGLGGGTMIAPNVMLTAGIIQLT